MKRFIPLMIVLLLTLVLAFVINDFVRLVIVEPLLLLFWVTGTFLRNLPHLVFWVVFLLVTLNVLLKSLNAKAPLSHRRRKTIVNPSQGYVADWQAQLRRADGQLYFRWHLARSLAKLSQQILTTSDPLMDSLPPEIAAYFQSPAPRKPAARVRWYQRQPDDYKDPALELDPEVVVEYLEKETGWE
jgi:hypothetical protein